MKQWKGPVQDSAQEPPPPPPTSPASSCSALPPEARLGPLQSPLGLNQTADLASITRDADFEFLSESTAPRPGTGGTPSISDKLMNELERAEPLVVINANIHLSWIDPLCLVCPVMFSPLSGYCRGGLSKATWLVKLRVNSLALPTGLTFFMHPSNIY